MFTNYHILIVKYIGPSNYTGSRIKIISERFKESKTIDYDHEANNALEGAEKWLTGHGFNIIGHGEGKDHMYVITDTFISPKNGIKIQAFVEKKAKDQAKVDFYEFEATEHPGHTEICSINGKCGEYMGYLIIDRKKVHFISLYTGEVIKLDSLDKVIFD